MKGLCIMFWLGLCLLVFAGVANAQPTAVGKLREQVRNGPVFRAGAMDTDYVNCLNHLARAFYGVDADSAL